MGLYALLAEAAVVLVAGLHVGIFILESFLWTKPLGRRIFGTTALSFNQWCIAAGIALSLVVVEELIKLLLRHRGAPDPTAHQTQSLPAVPSVA